MERAFCIIFCFLHTAKGLTGSAIFLKLRNLKILNRPINIIFVSYYNYQTRFIVRGFRAFSLACRVESNLEQPRSGFRNCVGVIGNLSLYQSRKGNIRNDSFLAEIFVEIPDDRGYLSFSLVFLLNGKNI